MKTRGGIKYIVIQPAGEVLRMLDRMKKEIKFLLDQLGQIADC